MLSGLVGLVLALSAALVHAPAATAATLSATDQKSFIAGLVTAAQKAQRAFGVPASVAIAQAIVESDWGTSKAAALGKNYFNTRCGASMTARQFAALAEAQVNKPYVLGAEAAISNPNPAKFDCSELVEWLFGRSGTRITDLAAAQYNVTAPVPSGTSPKVGDLVFLRNNPARANGIGHVAVLTEKLSNGDWRIIEARGRAYGVVRSTLSYWKTRSYYAGLRRYAPLKFAGSDGVTASAASIYQSGCVTVGDTKYSKFATISDSFVAHAAAVDRDSAYADARAVMGNVAKFVTAIAKVDNPNDPDGYAKKITALIEDHNLRDHDVVPFTRVLLAGDKGAKVTALQRLLTAAGVTVTVNGRFDAATVSAVKKFQSAKKLSVDGEAGPMTLTALMAKLTPGASGARVSALHALLDAMGYATDSGSTFGSATRAAVESLQAAVGRRSTGTVDTATWTALFMSLDATAPTISGTAAVGEKLTAVPGDWGPGSVTFGYQWYRGEKAIDGATESSYTVTLADTDATLKVVVSGARSVYTTTRLTSAATKPVPKLTMTGTPTPKITGTAKVGEKLTAVPGDWAPKDVALAYQWYRGSAEIKGATASTYAVQPADAKASLKVAVTGTTLGYTTVTKTSAATDPVVGVITGATPVISGDAAVGETLTADAGSWEPAQTALTYRWYRNGTAITGATDRTYRLQASDLGATVKVKVTGTLSGFVTVAETSAATERIGKGTLTSATPRISGTPKAGQRLTVIRGTWGPGTVTYSYRWFRGSTPITGATGKSYLVKSGDKGAKITVRVRGAKSGYRTTDEKASVTIAR